MADYIDREKLKRRFQERLDWLEEDVHDEYSGALLDGCKCDLELIDEIPAADVAPVVHGHWKKDRDTIKCTVCGFGMFPNRYTFMNGVCVTDNELPNYCENCGVKMRYGDG